MTLCPSALRERLVGDLAHDVAVEAPPVAVDVEETVGGELGEIVVVELLLHRLGEVAQGGDGVGRAEHGGVVDDGPTRRRAARRAARRSAPAATRAARRGVHDGRQAGHLDEEERVATAAVDEVGDLASSVQHPSASRSRTPQTSAVASLAERRRAARGARAAGRAAGGHAELLVGALARDEQEWQVGQRCAPRTA